MSVKLDQMKKIHRGKGRRVRFMGIESKGGLTELSSLTRLLPKRVSIGEFFFRVCIFMDIPTLGTTI